MSSHFNLQAKFSSVPADDRFSLGCSKDCATQSVLRNVSSCWSPPFSSLNYSLLLMRNTSWNMLCLCDVSLSCRSGGLVEVAEANGRSLTLTHDLGSTSLPKNIICLVHFSFILSLALSLTHSLSLFLHRIHYIWQPSIHPSIDPWAQCPLVSNVPLLPC